VEEPELRKPIFVIGVPRSGTTAFFEDFSRNLELAWMSNYSRMFPRLHAVNLLLNILDHDSLRMRGRKDQYGTKSLFNKVLPRPDEAYQFWNRYAHPEFSVNYLLNTRATPSQIESTRRAVRSLVRYQGKSRFSAKITGPSRIGFLSTIFPDAVFIHIVRDGLAVTHSLLNIHFWQKNGGLESPWWQGGLSENYVNQWKKTKDPAILAALQWKQIIEHAREEATKLRSSQYVEIRYEDYMNSRETLLSALFQKLDLTKDALPPQPAGTVEKYNRKYSGTWDSDYIEILIQAMQPLYSELGYQL
jgi:omega-hydroxy-beta-dihydromenaquinone-9 sulfotransferase